MLNKILKKIFNKEKEVWTFWINNENKLVKYKNEKYWKLYNNYNWQNKDLFEWKKVVDYNIKSCIISKGTLKKDVKWYILEVRTETNNSFEKFDIPEGRKYLF